MIEIRQLTKRYRTVRAVDELTFTARPGRVTGFLGPNGAGKSTALRIALALDTPDSGHVHINNRPYRLADNPVREVGAVLGTETAHPGRSARQSLRCVARAAGISSLRVDHVLDQVQLADAADRRIGSLSLGMRQRLAIGTALLGDPSILILDEPINGLDPPGIRWIRELMRQSAAEGRTVLVSSHLMSEMDITADHIVIIANGRLLADTAMDELRRGFAREVTVRTPHPGKLAQVLSVAGARVRATSGHRLSVEGMTTDEVGEAAASNGITVQELTSRSTTLEEAYLDMTGELTPVNGGRTT